MFHENQSRRHPSSTGPESYFQNAANSLESNLDICRSIVAENNRTRSTCAAIFTFIKGGDPATKALRSISNMLNSDETPNATRARELINSLTSAIQAITTESPTTVETLRSIAGKADEELIGTLRTAQHHRQAP